MAALRTGAALAVLLLLQASAGAAPVQTPPGATLGAQRIGLVLATWGPEPVTPEQARAAAAETDAFIRAASFGKTWLDVDLIGWARALPSRPTGCNTTAINSTIQRTLDLGRFDRVAYVLPQLDCPWGGAYFPPGVWMLGRITMELFAHELGHNYGAWEEGPAWVCGGGCRVEDYASPYSVMGHGSGHFNAYEKWRFGWIERDGPVTRDGDHEVARIDRPSTLPHALFVVAGGDEYWIEYRPEVGWPVVHAGPSAARLGHSRYPSSNLLLAAARSRTFSVPGAFAVELAESDGERALLRFRWTDTKQPSRPAIDVATRGRLVTLRFTATDSGSGVEHFEVKVDGRVRRVVAVSEVRGRELVGLDPRLSLRLNRGSHGVAVRAVDRAGNLGPSTVRILRVR